MDYIDGEFHYQRPSDCTYLPPPPEPVGKKLYGNLINALGLSNSPTWDFPVDVTLDSPLEDDELLTPSSSASELPEIPVIMVTEPSSEPSSPIMRSRLEESSGLLTTYYRPQPQKPTFYLAEDEEERQSGRPVFYDGDSEYDEDDIVLSEVKKSLQLSRLGQSKMKSNRARTGRVMRLFNRD